MAELLRRHHNPCEVRHRGAGGSVDADQQLRDAVLALTDAALRAQFAAAARRLVLRRTWSTVGDELLAHYREVLSAATVAA